MPDEDRNDLLQPIGQAWLRREFQLSIPPVAVESFIVPSARRTETVDRRTREFYPRQYAPEETAIGHLRFALTHEPVDLGLLVAAMKAMPKSSLEGWVRRQPTGRTSRRAWFLYETLLSRTLDLPDATRGPAIPALDPKHHVTGTGERSSRHRVLNNLLGTRGFCPFVRWTPRLREQAGCQLDNQARDLLATYDSALLARAVRYLFTKETRSSFEIEHEIPQGGKAERFIAALLRAPSFLPDERALIELQGMIVDPRYAATGWRTVQNFVGSVSGYWNEVHFICPRPQEIDNLMRGWMAMTRRLSSSTVDPVIAAALVAFSFVFLHPFEDGNGRIHRFLIHSILSRRGYSPEGIIFPVSASILREPKHYDEVLESFSKPLMALTDWHWTSASEETIAVENDTSDYFRYFDATLLAEYLYDRIADTVKTDLRGELDFLRTFDKAFRHAGNIVDMPDRRLQLFVKLCMQNSGSLSQNKRSLFAELKDSEVDAMERAVQDALADGPPNPGSTDQ